MIKKLIFLYLSLHFVNSYSQSINIVKPSAGEFIEANSLYTSTWTGGSISDYFLELSINAGLSWINLDKYLGSTNSVNFFIPNLFSSKCKLRIISSLDSSIYGITDSLFSIFGIYDTISLNKIKMFFSSNGMGSHFPKGYDPDIHGGPGFFWLDGDTYNVGAVYIDGLQWGGKTFGDTRIGGSHFYSGLMPGNIQQIGVPNNPADSLFKIWKIRKNWESLPPSPFRDRLEHDYNNWPVSIGAPWYDLNGDGLYTPGIDKPKFLGDEVNWFVMNDLDSGRTTNVYASNPFGLELQCSIYAYDSLNILSDVIFKKYKVINKSTITIQDMYISYWADPDIGKSSDDFAGCDSSLNLGYCYNGTNEDAYFKTPPPAVGYIYLQGPIIPGLITDSAFFDDKWIKGYKNLKMTSFIPRQRNFLDFCYEPNYGTLSGAIETYRNMKGLRNNGDQMIDPHSNKIVKFGLPGDPENKTGWFDGLGFPPYFPSPHDVKFLMTSGPFNMAPSDTQEVVFAVLMARGTNQLNSVTELKNKSKAVQNFYYTGILSDIVVDNISISFFKLDQNYPNPFNPITSINFVIPNNSHVTLKVFDILGRDVATLVNEEKESGSYSVTFDASSISGLSSGVYIYRLTAGNFSDSKKMLLLK